MLGQWIDWLFAVACCAVLRATASPPVFPQNCADCVSRTWSCRKSCRPSDTKLLEFDFQYKELPCREVIPWNESSLQIDTDLWCTYPRVAGCDFWGNCNPSINCRNMNRYAPPRIVSAMDCESSASVSSLVVEKCYWHCKHQRPVARCVVSFDSLGKYRMQQRLDKCWIQEKCQNRNMKAKAICKPEPPPADLPSVEVSGSMMLLVKQRAKFLAQPNLNFALQDAIIRMVPQCDFGHVFVQAQWEVPPERSNRSNAVKVDFNMSVLADDHGTSDERALIAEMALQNVSDVRLLEAVNGGLSSEGLKFLVDNATLNVQPVRLNETLQRGPGSEQEFFETVTMMRFYQKHLEEVGSELQELQADLKSQNSQTLPENVRAKQSAAAKRLSQIMASQDQMSSYVAQAMTRHTSNSEAFQDAWNRSQAVALELAAAKANLSSTKAELAELQAKRFRAEQQALEALRQQGKLNTRLKANATRLARSVADAEEELEYLQDQFLETQHDHTEAKKELSEAEKALQKEISEHGQMLEELESADRRISRITLSFGLVMGCMAIIIVALGSALVVCGRQKAADISVMPIAEGASENSVVVGRPVQVTNDSSDPCPAKTDELPTLLTNTSLTRCMGSPMNKPAASFKE